MPSLYTWGPVSYTHLDVYKRQVVDNTLDTQTQLGLEGLGVPKAA